MNKIKINNVAVLGAGVMGAQIAAHFANCNYNVYLYDLPGRASAALSLLTKQKPSPLVTLNTLELITPCDYDNNLDKLFVCDLIIEAVAENFEIKSALYSKVSKYLNPNAIFCSNTSGLSITSLAGLLDNNLAARFCGMHFFNPPRYQKLVELIPHSVTNQGLVDQLEEFLTSYLGKTIVRAKDTPNFIANRIGVFSMLIAMYHAARYNLSFDTVDALTGELIGRPKSATFRTADVVGLDTLASVIKTLTEKRSTDVDPWSQYLVAPESLLKLISHNYLGQKTGKGFYQKNPTNGQIEVYDLKTSNYLPVKNDLIEQKLLEILKVRDPLEKFTKLREQDSPQAKFLWDSYRDVWHYAIYHLKSIASCAEDLDLAMKCGFGWKQGPFELMRGIGWNKSIDWLNDDIENNLTLSQAKLPEWVYAKSDLDSNGEKDKRNHLSFYSRQDISQYKIKDNLILENNSAYLWRYKTSLVFSFKTKMNIINSEVINLLDKSVDYLNTMQQHKPYFNNMVIWQDTGDNFCAGADLKGFLACVETSDYILMDDTLIAFQQCCQKLKYSALPVIAAVRGLALGGGCELLMHCSHVVAAQESYIGLVETGVGVVPAGGGCKEMVQRANRNYKKIFNNDPNLANIDRLTEQYYKNIVMATVSSSASDAVNLGYLRFHDVIIANSNELLYTANVLGDYLDNCNYKANHSNKIIVGGDRLKANIYNLLANYLKGGFISDHDYLIGASLAKIFSGGVDSNQVVSEQWLLDLERAVFIDLLKTSKTRDRITHMLTKGRPLRN